MNLCRNVIGANMCSLEDIIEVFIVVFCCFDLLDLLLLFHVQVYVFIILVTLPSKVPSPTSVSMAEFVICICVFGSYC